MQRKSLRSSANKWPASSQSFRAEKDVALIVELIELLISLLSSWYQKNKRKKTWLGLRFIATLKIGADERERGINPSAIKEQLIYLRWKWHVNFLTFSQRLRTADGGNRRRLCCCCVVAHGAAPPSTSTWSRRRSRRRCWVDFDKYHDKFKTVRHNFSNRNCIIIGRLRRLWRADTVAGGNVDGDGDGNGKWWREQLAH